MLTYSHLMNLCVRCLEIILMVECFSLLGLYIYIYIAGLKEVCNSFDRIKHSDIITICKQIEKLMPAGIANLLLLPLQINIIFNAMVHQKQANYF